MESSSDKSKFWAALIQEWRTGSLTKKDFAKQKGVSLDVMNYWISKFNKSSPSGPKNSLFVPAVISDSACDQTITVHLSNGLSLALGPDIPTAKICALASVLSATYA